MAFSAFASSLISAGAAGGDSAPIASRSGDVSFDFGPFGGVDFGAGNQNQTVLYVALAAVALLVVVAVMRR